MGLLTKYVLFAQLIVLILFILPVLVLAKQVPADSIYVSYPISYYKYSFNNSSGNNHISSVST